MPEKETGDTPNKDTPAEGTTDHPPWTRQLKVHDPNEPLLAPLYRERPENRDPVVHGRLYTHMNYTWDSEGDYDSEYYLGRVGVSGTATNLFHKGGRLQFAGEGNTRGVNLDYGEDSSETRFRADRLSYAIGGHEHSDYRGEFGRFYSRYVPELGLMDGLEGVVRYSNGVSTGVGLGAYPVHSTDRDEWDDVGFHVFVDYESQKDYKLRTTTAYQKTWHNGEEDRDLVMGRISVHPSDSIWLHGFVKADIHTSEDTLEDDSVEVSEAWFQVRYVADRKKGASLSYSHYSWPELKRAEYQGLPDELFSDGYVDRGSLYTWYRVTKKVRVTARGNVWIDQDNTGGGGELGVDWTDIADKGTSLHGSVSYTEATFNTGLGFRGELRQRLKVIDLFAGYRMYQYTQDDLISDDDFVRHTLRSGVDWAHGKWYTSLSGDYYFGDNEDALGVMLFNEYRF